MPTPAPNERDELRIPPGLRDEVAEALALYIGSRRALGWDALAAATRKVGTEARAMRLPPECMVIDMRALFNGIPLSPPAGESDRSAAFADCLTHCLTAYFEPLPNAP